MHRKIGKILLAALALSPLSGFTAPAKPAPAPEKEAQVYATPNAAAQALLEVAKTGDKDRVAALFGSEGAEILFSGDPVTDENNREAFLAMAKEKLSADKAGEDRAVVHAGKTDWPFPVPLVKAGDGWRFDAEQGHEEILNRRIGRNELNAISVVNGCLEAEYSYANVDRNGDGISEYARKFFSAPGQFDGLYWKPEPGQPESPLGPLAAKAQAEGYRVDGKAEKPTPYYGYYYRILTQQGPDAPGGKYSYIINGNMIAGFAILAFPADYGHSGVMTFIASHQGKIYEKDLGPKTAKIAAAMKDFNPGSGWEPVETGE